MIIHSDLQSECSATPKLGRKLNPPGTTPETRRPLTWHNIFLETIESRNPHTRGHQTPFQVSKIRPVLASSEVEIAALTSSTAAWRVATSWQKREQWPLSKRFFCGRQAQRNHEAKATAQLGIPFATCLIAHSSSCTTGIMCPSSNPIDKHVLHLAALRPCVLRQALP